jgi:glycosyltransferase involved in cell wall biosynthesis
MKVKLDQLITQFNSPDVHLVISAWPEKTKHGEVSHGIAWYTKLTLLEMAKRKNMRFVVLAEKELDNEPRIYAGGKILVIRAFDNKHPSLYPIIMTWLTRFTAIKAVSVHSEFGVNTGLGHYLLLVPFLALIKLFGKKIIYYAHNVITDVSFLSSHINLPDNVYLHDAINLLVRLHAKSIGWLSDRVVTLDPAIDRRLSAVIGGKKLKSSAIPVLSKTGMVSQKAAHVKLGIPADLNVIMTFGFVSAYKGTDWVVRAFDQACKTGKAARTMLIVAGGPAHSLSDKPYYRKFYADLEKISQTNPAIKLTGFVPEKDISLYYSATDLAIMPYRGLMGASGAMTQALAHRKPFLLSQKMDELFADSDIRGAADTAHLTKNQVFFPLSDAGMKQIIRTVQSQNNLKKLSAMNAFISNNRNAVKQVGILTDLIRTVAGEPASLPVINIMCGVYWTLFDFFKQFLFLDYFGITGQK